VPDFARDEFVDAGIIFHDAEHHTILGRISRNSEIYRCIDREGRYMLFVEATERLIGDLQKDVDQIKKGIQKKVPALVEKAFLGTIIANAGFLDFSNIRSGVTDDIGEKFEWLFKGFVDAAGEKPKEDRPPAKKKEAAVEIVNDLLDHIRSYLKRRPESAFVHYSVTGGRYRFDVSFDYPDNVYLKILGLQAAKKGSVDLRNIVRAVLVLSDIKREQPEYTFGVILYVPRKLKPWLAGKTVARLWARFRESGIDLVMADSKEMKEYFQGKKLLH